MTEIVNSDDVEVIFEPIDASGSVSLARVEVDEFSITETQNMETHAGVGSGGDPKGLSLGDKEYQFSYTLLGNAVSVYQTVGDENGNMREYNMTARIPVSDVADVDVGDNVEFALTGCKNNEEGLTASSGDAVEYSVSGYATGYDRDVF